MKESYAHSYLLDSYTNVLKKSLIYLENILQSWLYGDLNAIGKKSMWNLYIGIDYHMLEPN